MPLATPIRATQPQFLEQTPAMSKIRQASENTAFLNNLAETLLPGEPIFKFGLLGIAHAAVLPGTVGEFWASYLADFLLADDHVGDIVEETVIFYDYDKGPAGEGRAVTTLPTNGYTIGWATTQEPYDPNNRNPVSDVVATTNDKFVRVRSFASSDPAQQGITPWG